MRSRANSGPRFHLAGLPHFTCKQEEKRRGWDSNPREGYKPSTRFPVALLRPTRTPLLKTLGKEFIKQSAVSMTPQGPPLDQGCALRAGDRRLVPRKLFLPADCPVPRPVLRSRCPTSGRAHEKAPAGVTRLVASRSCPSATRRAPTPPQRAAAGRRSHTPFRYRCGRRRHPARRGL
jgi:hypothetical protein